MKKRAVSILAPAAFVLLPLSLTNCVITESDLNEAVNEANVSGSPQKSQNVYEMGVRMGRQDGKNGLSRNPNRYQGQYAAAESDAFSMGYEKGYNQGIR